MRVHHNNRILNGIDRRRKYAITFIRNIMLITIYNNTYILTIYYNVLQLRALHIIVIPIRCVSVTLIPPVNVLLINRLVYILYYKPRILLECFYFSFFFLLLLRGRSNWGGGVYCTYIIMYNCTASNRCYRSKQFD